MNTKDRDAEFSRMSNCIEKFCSEKGYQDLIITLRNLSEGFIHQELLIYNPESKFSWEWQSDWDEGQEFEFIGLTPVDEVSTKYIHKKYSDELFDDSISEWCLGQVESLTVLPTLYCEKCGGETINRTPHCPYCGRNMTNASFESRRIFK